MNMSDDITQLAEALCAFQGELDAAKKTSKGYNYTYSDLATVIASAKPLLKKHGLAVSQLVSITSENYVSLDTILMHVSGQYICENASLPIVDMKGCNSAQGAGAAISYLRRYAYQAIIGQPSEDNDAGSWVAVRPPSL